jgi:actin-related protein
MPSAIRRIDVAGRDVTEHLQILLRKSGAVFHTSAEKEVVRMIKEKTCFVALDPKKEEKDWAGSGAGKVEEKYKLPDGNVLKVGLTARVCIFQLLTGRSSVRRDSERRKFYLIPKSLGWNILEFTRL